MKGLPDGWATATLADLGEWSSGGTPNRANEGYFGGDIPFVKTGDLRDETLTRVDETLTASGLANSSAKIFPAGTLLIAMYGATIGRTARLAFDAATNQACAALLENEANAECMDFVWRYLRSQTETLKAAGKGGAQPNISQTVLKEFPIPLPPLLEQCRIVRKLDAINARSATARTHLVAIKKLVERYKMSVLGTFFPHDLPARPLGVSCSKVGSGATPRGGKNVYLPEGTPLIRSQNIRFEGFDWDGLAFISDEHADELRNVTVRTGDVLLNITGASIGRVCLAPEEMDGARVNQHVSIIRPNPKKLDAGFVQYFLSSPAIQNWIWNANYGVTRQALTKGMIKEITIPDISLKEQRDITRRIKTAFAKVDRLATEAAKALKMLGHLDQRLLAKAFAGELVPQDPNDEPAETLLARIREARANAPKKTRQSRTKVHAVKEAPKDRLIADSATWPRNGLLFEDIATRVMMPHDELRDAIFELLGGDKPMLEQVFDTSEERMRLKRVAQ